jgi:hypothetical protein
MILHLKIAKIWQPKIDFNLKISTKNLLLDAGFLFYTLTFYHPTPLKGAGGTLT